MRINKSPLLKQLYDLRIESAFKVIIVLVHDGEGNCTSLHQWGHDAFLLDGTRLMEYACYHFNGSNIIERGPLEGVSIELPDRGDELRYVVCDARVPSMS